MGGGGGGGGGIQNTAQKIQNPTINENPESKFRLTKSLILYLLRCIKEWVN